MNQQYLLTYDVVVKGTLTILQTYCWFEHEEDMNDFINSNEIIVIDKIKINLCENL
jgi:hypothetical protein